MASLILFLLIVLVSLLAPVYASDIAHVNPFVNNLNGTTVVGGKVVSVMQQGGGTLGLGETPIGPTGDFSHYFLGADNLGRDVMARLLYGGRTSLQIGFGSAFVCCAIATIVALIAGFFGGVTDAILSRLMDLIWAFPVYLLAICISTVLLTSGNGLQVGPLHLVAGSLWLPSGRLIANQPITVPDTDGESRAELLYADVCDNRAALTTLTDPGPAVRFTETEDQHPNRNQHKGEEGADV